MITPSTFSPALHPPQPPSPAQKEIRDIERYVASGVTVALRGDSLRALVGCFPGPADTAYEGGRFYVDIQLDEQYPFVPPRMRLTTKCWHPNISSQTGAICLDVLKDQWSPALTLKTALLSLQALLSSPQPDDPQDAVVARQFLDDRAEFERTARAWTAQHARARDAALGRLLEMGFERGAAEGALARAGGDEAAATELLLGGS